MQIVLLLALLLQAASVTGLAAVYVPKNNDVSPPLPWMGTEAWSTNIQNLIPTELVPSSNGEDLLVRGMMISGATCYETRLVSFNANVGKEQWTGGAVGACHSSFAPQLPYIATASFKDGVTVFLINTSGVVPLHTYPDPAKLWSDFPVLSVGNHFYRFTTLQSPETFGRKTILNKIDPRSGASSTFSAPLSNTFYAGLNHIFAVGNSTNALMLACLSPSQLDGVWSVDTKSIILHVIPSPFTNFVLLMYANSSITLLNSLSGEWTWTVLIEHTPEISLASAFFFPDVVIVKAATSFSGLTSVAAVNLSTGSVLWNIPTNVMTSQANVLNCALEGNIFVSVVQSTPATPMILLGLDAYSGNKVFEYTPALGNTGFYNPTWSCLGNDLFFSVINANRDGSIIQRIKFEPRP